MSAIESVIIEAADAAAAQRFVVDAFGLDGQVQSRESDAASSGFRGFTLSLIVAQPSTVESLFDSAVASGATPIKPVAKSMWGVGGVVQAPDGTIWKVATSAKRDSGPGTRRIDRITLLLGAEDVSTSKRFYMERGFAVGKSFGSYVEFASAPEDAVAFALYKHRALAKDAGVDPVGTGSHRIAVRSAAGPFTDPDGFTWEAPAA